MAIWSFFPLPISAHTGTRGKGSRFDYAWAVGRAVAAGLVALLTSCSWSRSSTSAALSLLMFAGLDFLGLLLIRFWFVWYFRRSCGMGTPT